MAEMWKDYELKVTPGKDLWVGSDDEDLEASVITHMALCEVKVKITRG